MEELFQFNLDNHTYDLNSINSNESEHLIFNNNYLLPQIPSFINEPFELKDIEVIESQNNCNLYLEKETNNKSERTNISSLNKNKEDKFSVSVGGSRKIENQKKNLNFVKKAKVGRKRKGDNSIGEHNKFSEDNILRKCLNLILNNAYEFLNERIKSIYNGNIGNGILKKQLLFINNEQKSDNSFNYYKKILNKTLGEIFSGKISLRYTNIYPEYNKSLIERLLNDKDENKKIFFRKLFSITFIMCLKQYRGTETFEELKGFKNFIEEAHKFKNEAEYINNLEKTLMNYEDIIKNKKDRKLSKKKEKKLIVAAMDI
jgi:hypothetical protein